VGRGTASRLAGLNWRSASPSEHPEFETVAFLAAIIESSNDAIISMDLNGTIISWNQAAEDIFGYKEEEALGRGVSLIIPPERLIEEEHILECIRKGERVDHYETVRRRKDGTPVDISLTISPIRNVGGRIIGASKIARDITEQHLDRELLRQSEERLRVTLASIGDAMISTDENGRVKFMSAVAESLTGWKSAEAVGQPLENVFRVIDESTRQPLKDPLVLVLERGGVARLGSRMMLISKDGNERSIDDSVAPIRAMDGALVGVVLVFRDATHIRAAARMEVDLAKAHADLEVYARNLETLVAERTAKLQQTIADLEAFSFTISHDLRSPLRSMEGFAHALLSEYADKLDELGRNYLERISNSAVRLDRLILEVLTYSRVGRSNLEIIPIDLDKLIEEVLDTYPAIRSANAEIRVEHPLHAVMGSRASLVQCVSNLLTNAVKFMPPGKQAVVRVWTEKYDSTVHLFVEDNGIGIPVNLQDKIFEPFQRAHPELGYEGTGMGLAIVRKAMQRMNGSVGVESSEGQGSTFWLELPEASK